MFTQNMQTFLKLYYFFLNFVNLFENLYGLRHFRIYSNERVFCESQVTVQEIVVDFLLVAIEIL